MTATTSPLRQVVVHPDDYLDCRRPSWESYEARGLIRFERELGAKTPMVLVDSECLEVLQILQSALRRPIKGSR
jgi:hypothetical protein